MGQAEKVVVVVFDGLRPDMVGAHMPVLQAFLDDNLRFSNARSVFPSLTRVCTTSVSTGMWPGRHGIVNNAFHLSGDLQGRLVDTADFAALWGLKERSGAIVTSASMGERLASSGRTLWTMHCGSAGSGLLINHAARENGHQTFSIHGAVATLTPEIVPEIVAKCGPIPEQDLPRLDVVAYTGRIATEFALAERQADVTVVWLPEPDTSYHYCGIHSAQTQSAMRAADLAFAEILETISRGTFASTTAVIAMSDHGQIATEALVDLKNILRDDGFKAGGAANGDTDILMTGGNMGELRPISSDVGLLTELGHWLMDRPEIGMVFADPDLIDGALPPSAVFQTHARSAELIYVMRSRDEEGPRGIPGIGPYTGGVPLGGGMHGGLSDYEMNTVLGISAPGARKGQVDDTPASLIDIAPTVLDLFGMDLDCDGRVLPLFEPEQEDATVEELRAARGGFAQRLLRQSIQGRDYLIKGGRL
ncbi:MAG: alkaline phosphatase family protein [Paracoccaceae bacterium]|nr:alkaline phosphatase family protein [Paracoccaceae bacterium]